LERAQDIVFWDGGLAEVHEIRQVRPVCHEGLKGKEGQERKERNPRFPAPFFNPVSALDEALLHCQIKNLITIP
jgi:hypothetical protein